jgi:dTDP-glucose pyrophosphorylase
MNDFSKYLIDHSASVRDALVKLEALSGDTLTLFVMDGNKMVGTLTDGDIRRFLIKEDSLNVSVEKVMNRNYVYIFPNETKIIQKIRSFRMEGIELLPCVDYAGCLIRVHNLRHKKSILPVDAVLMAGGKGERLRPLTEKTPKPLLKIGEKAIIDYNVDNLIHYGVEHIHVTTNYLSEQIEAHFKEKRRGIKVKCVKEHKFLGTIASVKCVPDIINNEVLIMNSDLFTNIDFEDFYCYFQEKEADMLIGAIPYSINLPYGILDLEGRKIKGIKEKPTYNYYANAGIYLIKKELIELIPDEEFFNATDLMDLLISQSKNVIRYPLTGYWIDIGKPADYQKAQELVKHINSKL